MGFETANTSNETPKDFDAMDFNELEADETAGPVLQAQALQYLRTEQSDYFKREFNDKLDADGYLIKKADGMTSNTKPSQNIGGGKAMDEVVRRTKEALK